MALIDKASLLMVPSTYEAGTLYNVLPSGNRAPDSTDQNSGYDQTRADFTFDRGSNAAATRVNADGLIEKYRENLLVQSNQFDTTWTRSSAQVPTDSQSGYDETNDAWLLTASGTNARIENAQSGTGVYTLSCYMKKGTTDWARLSFFATNNPRAYFDLNNGVVGVTAYSIDASIENVGGGWYRCSITANLAATTSAAIFVADGDDSLQTSNETIYIQNAQLETGLVSTDYLDSGATTAKAGVLIDLPRINYDANGENGALLLEPSRTNLLPNSEYFGAWTLNSNGTGSDPVLDFGHTSPEGKDNAYKVTLDSGAGTTTSDESIMYLNKSGLTAGSEHTASVYLKGAVGGEEVIVRDVTGAYIKWTLTTEWARYELTQTAAGSSYATSFGIRQGLGGIGTINSSAVVYIYGFQSELGSYKTSYIPNHGTSGGVTRAADDCLDGGNSNVFDNDNAVWFIDMERIGTDSAVIGDSLSLRDSSNVRQITLWFDAPTKQIRFRDGKNSFTTIGSSGGAISTPDNTRIKIALKIDGTTLKVFADGVQKGSNYTRPTAFDITQMDMQGKGYKIRNIQFYNSTLTDAECISLTS